MAPSWVALVCAAIGLFAFQLYQLYGLHVSKDLPLWDESAYLGWGEKFLQTWKVGSITNSPFYHILYGAVISVVGLLRGFYAMQYLLKLTLTLLVFLLSFRFSRSISLSLLLGTIVAYSYFHLGIDVLVYYGALIPYLLAILAARRAPALSLGFSFLAGLGRLEYMAVPLLHGLYLLVVWWRKRRGAASSSVPVSPQPFATKLAAAAPATALWLFNLFVLTRVTVWQFHNRVWFAWSQNYAFFRYQTGRDSGGNPWLDHQVIAERDFPGAHSLAEAFKVNAPAVLQHTWYNIRMIPEYLAGFVISPPNAGHWTHAPVFALAAIALCGLLALALRRPRGAEFAAAIRARSLELVLCLGGIVAAAPSIIVSSKLNYIMSLVPAALLTLALLHRLALRLRLYARASAPVFLAFTGVFATATFVWPPAYSTHYPRGGVYQDALTMRSILRPFHGLKILGVSTASYINYLGRANGHVFIEPLAISPVNPQASDLTLVGLIRTHDPDVLLINSSWQSSKSYATAMAGFDFAGWDAHPLVDGTLYTRAGLILRPEFSDGWFEQEQFQNRVWHWSRGDATIKLHNAIANRALTLRFRTRSIVPRTLEVSLNGRQLARVELGADVNRDLDLKIPALPAGDSVVKFHTDQPAARPSGGDTRELGFTVENLQLVDASTH
ncbi:MAG TPA: hypothetical protein VHD62_03905 [Opitutaceae bacterium]|nr:hypothetical protein [Opitutaceae bacterium]